MGVAAASIYRFGFVLSVLVTVCGGMLGVFFFAFVWKEIEIIWKRVFQRDLIAKKIKYTKFKRFVVRFRQRFGVAGIAFLTPILLQVPVGTVLAMRLDKNFKKVSLYMLLSFLFYSVIFFGLCYGLKFNINLYFTKITHGWL